MGLKERILVAVGQNPGLTDREITDLLLGASTPQQSVNQAARALANAGLTARVARPDGKIGNFPQAARPPERSSQTESDATASDGISEDMVKRAVAAWLEASDWTVEVRWGRERGIDVEALRKSERWIVEAKGGGSRDAMRVNYFIAKHLALRTPRLRGHRRHPGGCVPGGHTDAAEAALAGPGGELLERELPVRTL